MLAVSFCLLVGAFRVDLFLFEYLIYNHMVSGVGFMRILHGILFYDLRRSLHVFISISVYV